MIENGGQRSKGQRDSAEELVAYTAPLMPWRTDRDIFVAVNGESIRIKRGAEVQIKRKFLEVIAHAEAQELAAYQYMKKARKQGEAIANL